MQKKKQQQKSWHLFESSTQVLYHILQVSLQTYLSTKCACVLGMLGYFHLFNHLPQRGTISGTIFAGDSNLLSSLCLEMSY